MSEKTQQSQNKPGRTSGRDSAQNDSAGREASRQSDSQRDAGQGSRSAAGNERGATTIEDAVVARISGVAAQEVDGVHMGGGASRAVGGLIGSVTGSGGGETRGVSVEVGQEETAIDLSLAIDYGKSIPQVAEAVRKNIVSRVESLVGLKVNEVNIDVNDIVLPNQNSGQQESRQIEGGQTEGGQTGQQSPRVQ